MKVSRIQHPPISSKEMKALDTNTIETHNISSAVLMERASLAVYEVVAEFNPASVLCICGTGNNGGDGICIARLLHLAGVKTSVLLTGDRQKCSIETKSQLLTAESYGVAITDNIEDAFDVVSNPKQTCVIVDALFGIGLDRNVTGKYSEVIKATNAWREIASENKSVVSVDIPSGISADTGRVLGAAVRADTTVTFAVDKIGLRYGEGPSYAGMVRVADIGIYLEPSLPTIKVAGAIILRENRLLATQRGYGDYEGWWEFPGGKQDAGETPEETLTREIREELRADIHISSFFMRSEYDYPKFHLSMECYLCELQGNITLTEHRAAIWLTKKNVYDLKWLGADLPVIDALISAGLI